VDTLAVACSSHCSRTGIVKRRTRRDYMRNLASLQAQQASIAAEKTRLDGCSHRLRSSTENECLLRRRTGIRNKPSGSVFDLCASADALANYFTRQTIELPRYARRFTTFVGRDFVLQDESRHRTSAVERVRRRLWEMAGLPAVIKLGRNPLTGLGKGQDDV